VTSESPSATLIGDLVVVLYGNDFYTLANMGVPTATGTPTMNAITGTGLPADGGSNLAHTLGYWYVANTAGAQTISATETGSHDEEKCLVAYVLSGADTTTPIDAAAGNTGSGTTSMVAPAVSPATADAYVVTLTNTGGGGSVASYTTPAPLTEDAEIHVGGLAGVYAHAQLSVSGSTGTFTFTAASSQPYAAITAAIKTAAAGPAPYPFELLTQTPRSY
jgi:hypothetical protein